VIDARARDVRTMKRRATGLLVVISAIWVTVIVAAHGRGGWYAYVQAAAEASMVGALADWFAVVAIFRHPLGLPIPHTAVMVERKDQFGRALGDFVQENFLSADVLGQRVRSGRYVERAARWLQDEQHASTIAKHATSIAVEAADLVRDEDVSPIITEALERAVRSIPLARVAGKALETMTAEGRHEEVLEAALRSLERFLLDNRDSLELRFTDESPWWLPEAVEHRIFTRMLDGVVNLVHDAANDGEHQLRQRINEWLRDTAAQLQTSDELAARIDQLKLELLRSEEVRRWSSSIWTDLKAQLRAQASDDDSELRRRITDALVTAGHRIVEDQQLLERAEHLAESGARQLADRFNTELADLVATTITRWDSEETAQRVEDLLGRDLQFIRINGTIVGGIAGLALYAIARLIASA
jgi:uncharacterized membrane-anchored protein YjiN (DUF445 family)